MNDGRSDTKDVSNAGHSCDRPSREVADYSTGVATYIRNISRIRLFIARVRKHDESFFSHDDNILVHRVFQLEVFCFILLEKENENLNVSSVRLYYNYPCEVFIF